jgi:hypothetical protein
VWGLPRVIRPMSVNFGLFVSVMHTRFLFNLHYLAGVLFRCVPRCPRSKQQDYRATGSEYNQIFRERILCLVSLQSTFRSQLSIPHNFTLSDGSQLTLSLGLISSHVYKITFSKVWSTSIIPRSVDSKQLLYKGFRPSKLAIVRKKDHTDYFLWCLSAVFSSCSRKFLAPFTSPFVFS